MKLNKTIILTLSITLSIFGYISCSFPEKTNFVNDKEKHVTGLVGLKVKCPEKQLIQGFHLIRNGENQIGYEYKCFTPAPNSNLKKSTKSISNPWTDIGTTDKATNYLDRQTVECPANMGLNSFNLEINNSKTKMRYVYFCTELSVRTCSQKSTQLTDSSSNFQNIYLDRQTVTTERADQFLQKFRLATIGQNFKYDYTYCDQLIKPKPEKAQVLILDPELAANKRNSDNQII